MKLHRLLERQAKRHGVHLEEVSPEVRALLQAINTTYEESDKDRGLLERSLDLSSHELGDANQELIRKNSSLLLLSKISTLMQFRASMEATLEGIVSEVALATRLPGVAVQVVNAATGERELKGVAGMSHEEWLKLNPLRIFSVVVTDEGTMVGRLSAARREDDTGAGPSPELLNILSDVAGRIGTWIGARRAEAIVHDQQMQLMNSAKMSALGQMAGGIAHEINNPIAVIQSLSEEIIDAASVPNSKDEIVDLARRICSTSTRVSKIVAGLRTFSRDGKRDPFESADLRKIFDETAILCMERFKRYGVELNADALPEGLDVRCQSVQISQVILNLLHNSLDAIKDLPDRWVKVTAKDLGSSVEFRVTDSGKGISPESREKIFQPFFTTKEVGKGTGLGLSISLGIAVSHRGSLTIDAQSPNTCFVLTLPKSRKETALTS